LLGRFEQAYDINEIGEMRKAALALYNLDVGEVAVQLFVAKNPIFFDATYNPTLVLGKLSTNGNSLGYSLANEFAEFMEFTISSCQRQIEIIAQVFVPELDAMTTFVNKVFEESIGEYLEFVLKFAKESGSEKVYLHTLASSVYCCTQFLDYLNKNGQVDVNTELIKKSVIKILKQYTDKYINLEVEVLQKQLIADVQEWDKMVQI
jgi:recyclin-1